MPTWANAGAVSPEARIALTIHFAFIVFLLKQPLTHLHPIPSKGFGLYRLCPGGSRQPLGKCPMVIHVLRMLVCEPITSPMRINGVHSTERFLLGFPDPGSGCNSFNRKLPRL